MTEIIKVFAGIPPMQESYSNLHAEIISFIEKRFADYDSYMEIPSREYFAEKIDDFLSTFSTAMTDCGNQLKGIARKVGKRLKVTLLNFYDYITRGLWLLRESPKCSEQLEGLYFIPESFDVEGLKELIADLKDSISYENYCDDIQLRKLISSLRTNLLKDLEKINDIIEGDMLGRGFAIRRWATRFRSDVRNIRSIYEEKWENDATKLSFSADYSLSRLMTLNFYYDFQKNTPLLTSSSYPTTTHDFGFSLKFSLTR